MSCSIVKIIHTALFVIFHEYTYTKIFSSKLKTKLHGTLSFEQTLNKTGRVQIYISNNEATKFLVLQNCGQWLAGETTVLSLLHFQFQTMHVQVNKQDELLHFLLKRQVEICICVGEYWEFYILHHFRIKLCCYLNVFLQSSENC
jgi:hypothetical protein